ncbi:hypothetical protein [Puia dinghuensis]|uniref:DUF4412 domain-containing protein n=1 Tax=Puia dinghuensis TaxID=1792502 RepID=A0A8J2U724_9BACT|nr:hypothetical protein [Puia dinghuensis]GGA82720.1 hypothetical protein GCM10011511_02170 [Puia dinghuensis]
MRKPVLLLFCCLAGLCLHAQYFEGKVIYKNTFTSKVPGLTDSALGAMMGSEENYYIKGGFYKSFLNGAAIAMQQYDHRTNRMYFMKPDIDTLYWVDAGKSQDKVLSYETREDAEVILGKSCDALVVQTAAGTTIFYYSPRYKLDAALFSRHTYGGWAFFLGKTGCLPLKTVIDNDRIHIESVATEALELELKDNFFEVSPLLPLVKAK